MIDQTDFIVLYRELGVGPDCSVDGLRLAYRRRVADLHPDRGGDSDEDELKSLNQRYAAALDRSKEHTSELQSLMRISYAVFCLQKKRVTVQRHIQRTAISLL